MERRSLGLRRLRTLDRFFRCDNSVTVVEIICGLQWAGFPACHKELLVAGRLESHIFEKNRPDFSCSVVTNGPSRLADCTTRPNGYFFAHQVLLSAAARHAAL